MDHTLAMNNRAKMDNGYVLDIAGKINVKYAEIRALKISRANKSLIDDAVQ